MFALQVGRANKKHYFGFENKNKSKNNIKNK
jgi:hypothetical protein